MGAPLQYCVAAARRSPASLVESGSGRQSRTDKCVPVLCFLNIECYKGKAEDRRLEDPAVLGPPRHYGTQLATIGAFLILGRPTLAHLSSTPYSLAYNMDRQTMLRDLKILESTYNKSDWLKSHDHEPLIGDPDCPALAQEYGISRLSCYSVFLEKINATYLCRFEACRGFSPCSLEDALRHQRYHHFDHRPFLCAPVNGRQW